MVCCFGLPKLMISPTKMMKYKHAGIAACHTVLDSWFFDGNTTQTALNFFVTAYRFLVHGGCPPASITQKRPNQGQVSVHGEPKLIEGQQPYVQ